jgi:hypothetical protein
MLDNIVIDDIIFDDIKDEVESMLSDANFPWYLSGAVSATVDNYQTDHFNKITDNIFEYGQLIHAFMINGIANSNYIGFAIDMINRVKEKYKISGDVIRIKGNLCTRVCETNPNAHQTPHIDTDTEHWVMIYYVNDSDGDTFLFDQRVGANMSQTEINELSVKCRVSPRKGRLLMFNGKYLHAGMHPRKTNYRMVINFNLKK